MKTEFPHIHAAIKTYSNALNRVEGRDLWAVGDAIIADVGRPAAESANDGSLAKLAVVARELAELDYPEYGVNWLRQLRATAATFPPNRRHDGITVHIHAEAGNPKVMDWIVKHADQPLTMKYVRRVAAEIAARQQQQATEKAKKTGEEAPPKPKRKEVEPPADDEAAPAVMRELEILGMAREAKRLGNVCKAEIERLLPDLDRTAINVIADHALAATEAWQQAAELVRKTSTNKRAHLAVVGEK